MPLALADPQVDNTYDNYEHIQARLTPARAESKYTENASFLSMNQANIKKL